MKNSVLSINKKLKKSLSLSLVLLFLVSGQMLNVTCALADDFVPIEDTEFYSNSITLDADDTGGDVTLQFGTTLSETIKWDYANSSFSLSNDLSLGQNELKDVAIDNLDTAPTTPTEGQIYYDTADDTIYMWDGTAWKDVIAEPHANSHIDGTDDIPLATDTTKGLMSPTQFQDLEDLKVQGDEINRNTIDVQLDLGEYVASSVAYLTYDNPDGTSFVANIENVEFTINDSPTTGIALTGGSDTNPTLNYIYVREDTGSAYVEASTTDPSTQAFDYVPIGEVLLGTVGASSATYYFIENLTNYIRNFIGDTNNRLRVTGVIWLSGIVLTNTGLEIQTTQGKVIHMHEEITYPAKDTTTDNLIDFYYQTYGALDNTNYDNGTGGNTLIGNNKFHKLFIWGDVYGGLHMERQRKPPSSEYTALAQAEEDPDKVAVATIPSQWATVGFPIAHLILQQGTADVLKIIDLRMGGGEGGTVAGGHTQNTDTGTTEDTFTLDTDNSGTNLNLIFGGALNESLMWDNANSRFTLSDDLRVTGNQATVGQTYIAGDHAATDSNGYLNLGRNSSAWENLVWNDATDRFELSDDLSLTGGIQTTGGSTIGNNTGTIAIDSTDWDITSTGAMTGIGAITMDGLLTGTAGATLSGAAINLNNNSNFAVSIGTGTSTGTVTVGGNSNNVVVDSALWNVTAGGALDAATVTSNGLLTGSAGATISGAATNINNNSNFATNINTGTSTGAISIGGGSGTVAVNSTNWDISSAGTASGFTGITSTGAINFAGASRLALHQGGANPGTCTEGDMFYNTGTHTGYLCTALNTWTALSSGNPDFETVYGADADKILNTSNGAFTVNTGTNDFVVTSNDWTVDASGNMMVYGNATLGVGGTDSVSIESSTWDVSSAGLATGLTGITSTGNINFVNANTFRIPQAAGDPATCNAGQQYYNTSTSELKLCIATNTWSGVGSTTGANYVDAYSTATQAIAVANTFQDVTYNSNSDINGWTHTPGTANFTCGASGLYFVTARAQAQKTNTGSDYISLRGIFNGAEVTGSQGSLDLDTKNVNREVVTNFLFYATTGQVLRIQAASSTTAMSLSPGGSAAATRPSAQVTIIRLN